MATWASTTVTAGTTAPEYSLTTNVSAAALSCGESLGGFTATSMTAEDDDGRSCGAVSLFDTLTYTRSATLTLTVATYVSVASAALMVDSGAISVNDVNAVTGAIRRRVGRVGGIDG